MIKVGIVGFGFMGKMHYNNYNILDEARVTAVCDADMNRLKDSSGTTGNIAGTEEAIDLSGLDLYSDYDKMLQEADVEAVSITLPTFLHVESTIKALEAGKHVLCEKPMGLNLAECDRMLEAAQTSGKILQIGHCVRFWPEYQKTKAYVDSGEYGSVLAGSFRRLSLTPTWSHENWLMSEQRSGGMELDLHIHDTDYIDYLLGTPKAVHSVGAKGAVGGTGHIMTQYLYDDNKAIFAEGGWLMQPSFGFEMSFNLVLEKATIVFDCTRDPSFKVCPQDGEAFTPEVASGDGYSRELEHFLQSVRGQSVPP
ncbi:gfo/Idh/MocA family oxidoreductase, partial [bacterium]|nr:gfo/Idh/MocA family oxidoreductase [bacterium]